MQSNLSLFSPPSDSKEDTWLRHLPFFPKGIENDDVSSEGELQITDESADEEKILIFTNGVAQKSKTSLRIRKTDLQTELKLKNKPRCGIVCQVNEKTGNPEKIFKVYKGKKHKKKNNDEKLNDNGCLVGTGGNGRQIKALQSWEAHRDPEKLTDSFSVLKTIPHDLTVNSPEQDLEDAKKKTQAEFILAKKMGQTQAIILQRPSPSHAEKLQDEIVMKFIPGQELRDVINSRKAIKVVFWLEIFCNMIESLKKLHALGYIHRDIKPENFMAWGTTMEIIDFGNAVELVPGEKHFHDPARPCTLGYLDPEAFKTANFSVSTDIYALGIVMAECLGFITPESGASLEELFQMGDTLYSDDGLSKLFNFLERGGQKIISKNSDEYKNSNIHEPLRGKLLDFIARMIGPSENRPALDECFKFFSKEHLEMTKTSDLNVLVIDVGDYLHNKDQKSSFHQLADRDDFDMLWFVESKKHTPKELNLVREEFYKHIPFIGKKVVSLAGKPKSELHTLLDKAAKKLEPGKRLRFTNVNVGKKEEDIGREDADRRQKLAESMGIKSQTFNAKTRDRSQVNKTAGGAAPRVGSNFRKSS